jgi:hypothetical protein
MILLQEAQEHTGTEVLWRVVEDDAHLVIEAEDGSGEALGTPARSILIPFYWPRF